MRTKSITNGLSRMELLQGIALKELLDTNEVAALLGKSPKTIRNTINEIPHYKDGHRVWFKKSEIIKHCCAVKCKVATI